MVGTYIVPTYRIDQQMGCGCGSGDAASGAVGAEGWPHGAGPPVLLACPAGAAAARPAGTALAYYL